MFDLTPVAEYSRAHCISLCAFLVPANLVATSVTMVLTALCRPRVQVLQAAGIAAIFAVVMILHVFTWFMIGVVMAPTYILLWLALTCLATNVAAIFMRQYFITSTTKTQVLLSFFRRILLNQL